MNDAISRQAAIDALDKLDISDGVGISSIACNLQKEAIRGIENLPSAEPERKTGKWIYLTGLDAFECSICGRQMVRNIFDYCP